MIEKRVVINEDRLPYIDIYISTMSREVKKNMVIGPVDIISHFI